MRSFRANMVPMQLEVEMPDGFRGDAEGRGSVFPCGSGELCGRDDCRLTFRYPADRLSQLLAGTQRSRTFTALLLPSNRRTVGGKAMRIEAPAYPR
jgi:hypothetical protein